LEDAIAQGKNAAQTALESGLRVISVEINVPEIALQAQTIALEFIQLFASYGSGLKVLFPDTGAAALARRDWGETEFKVSDLGSPLSSVATRIADDDEMFLVVSPSAVEVAQVEKLCNLAGDRPVVLLLPQLEDISIVGIGYAARQLRDRFISKIETAYYYKPIDGGAIIRLFPSEWEIQLDTEDGGYELIASEPTKPMGDTLEILINQAAKSSPNSEGIAKPKKRGVLGNLQQFLKALSQ
ncbi:MAG: DUF1995 family protein, partial [Jaaginema sp. PMC 1079.18]|nr:DUF1995 family protein [Jaaginema sp. PMC 1079.18]